MKDPGYVEHDGWRLYQPHLPERYRLDERNLPGEQSWSWDGLQVHLDRYETPDPSAVIVGLHGGGGYGRMLATIPSVVPARFLRTWFDYQPRRGPDTNTLPILLAHPGEDHWTPTALSQRFYDKLAGPKRLVILENCGHFPLEEPGLAQLETALREFAEQVAG